MSGLSTNPVQDGTIIELPFHPRMLSTSGDGSTVVGTATYGGAVADPSSEWNVPGTGVGASLTRIGNLTPSIGVYLISLADYVLFSNHGGTVGILYYAMPEGMGFDQIFAFEAWMLAQDFTLHCWEITSGVFPDTGKPAIAMTCNDSITFDTIVELQFVARMKKL